MFVDTGLQVCASTYIYTLCAHNKRGRNYLLQECVIQYQTVKIYTLCIEEKRSYVGGGQGEYMGGVGGREEKGEMM